MNIRWSSMWLATLLTVHSAASARTELQSITAKIHLLENVPLSSASDQQRADLFAWLVQSPDVRVNWCAGVLTDAPASDKDLAGGLLVQAVLSAGAFAIEHPDDSTDKLLTAREGLRGALFAYRATVAAETRRASKFFDELLELDTQGKLDHYLAPKLAACK